MRAGPIFATLLLCTIVAASQAQAQASVAAPAEEAYSETAEAAEPAPAAVDAAAEADYHEEDYHEEEVAPLTRFIPQIVLGLAGVIGMAFLARFMSLAFSSSVEKPAYVPKPALNASSRDAAATGPLLKSYFVSHATENSADAKKLVAALEAKGITCWIAPRNIKAGQAYGDAIGAAVARLTKATIVLVSAAAEKSDGVKAELELARRFQKPIVPVIINNHPPDKGMLYYIGTSHWVPFDGASAETITALSDAVSD